MKRMILLVFLLTVIVSQAQITKLPFKLLPGGHILLKVKMNKINQELDFVFDTGASTGVIDKATAKKLGLDSTEKVRVPGAGGVETYDLIRNQQLKISDKIDLSIPYMVSVDMTRFHEVSDKRYQGIIGYNLIHQNIMKIDYQNEELIIYKSFEDIDLNGYEKIPFEFHSGAIPKIKLSFTLNGQKYSGDVLFDSGAAQTLSINTPFVKKNNLNSLVDKKVVLKSENLGSTSTSEKIAIESVRIGKYKLNDLSIILSEDKQGVSSYDGLLGILGGKIIKRFNIILDYNNSTMYLKPNVLYKESFEFPMSSLRLKKKNGVIFIDELEENSSEYNAGLRKGDMIISMNGQSSKLIQFYKDLLKKEGETIKIKVKTKSKEIKTVSFTLKNLLK